MSGDRQRQVLDGSEDHLESGYGIRNINSRLKLCYGEMYGVSFDSAPGKGTTVHVRIPSMTLEQLEKRLR
jgi:two-component system sensor histidine kinase YesM